MHERSGRAVAVVAAAVAGRTGCVHHSRPVRHIVLEPVLVQERHTGRQAQATHSDPGRPAEHHSGLVAARRICLVVVRRIYLAARYHIGRAARRRICLAVRFHSGLAAAHAAVCSAHARTGLQAAVWQGFLCVGRRTW